jgi:hypothetical protein
LIVVPTTGRAPKCISTCIPGEVKPEPVTVTQSPIAPEAGRADIVGVSCAKAGDSGKASIISDRIIATGNMLKISLFFTLLPPVF